MIEPAGSKADGQNRGDGVASATPPPGERERMAGRGIEAALRRARLALGWEVLWPTCVPLIGLVGFFLMVSWLGLWPLLPDLWRIALLALFGLALLILLIPLLRLRWPDRAAAMDRLVRASGTPHRPASAFFDRLGTPNEDPLTRALWEAHRRRILETLGPLKTGWPSPGMNKRDPYALRYLLPLGLFVAFMVSGDPLARLAEAVRPTLVALDVPPRIDAWVTPPAYTGRPPLFLTGETQRPAEAGAITVPEGSIVTIRMPQDSHLTVRAVTADGRPIAAETQPPHDGQQAATTTQPAEGEHRFTLLRAGSVEIARSGAAIDRWVFAVTPDTAPTIRLTREPGVTASGALSLAYEVSDDYGVVAASGEISSAEPAAAGAAARPLIAAPQIPLALPRQRMRSGSGETIRDLTAHPWAGTRVKLVLVASDERGQTGRSDAVTLVLPERRFNNPLARAIVEQRRILALDAAKAGTVANALDAITLDPSKFDSAGVYLSLRAAYHRLTGARDDEDLVSVVDFLWTIALGIEDGNLSLAAEDLRAAQEKLRSAIANNASDAELDKAMKELREAMQRYLQALAQSGQRPPTASAQPGSRNVRQITPQDLAKLMDQIENLAKTGSREAAQQMLSQLQQMMENLQNGRAQQSAEGDGGKTAQTLNQLGAMIRRQQELMDQTFKLDPDTDGSGSAPQPMTDEERQKALDALRQGQQDLAAKLKELQDQMKQQGLQGEGKLDQAGRSMEGAAEQLGEGQAGAAVGSQGQAMQALREGARGLAESLARRDGTGSEQGGGSQPGSDPLGRERQAGRDTDFGASVKVPDAVDTQRAREILDTIRKRLGEAARPLLERDYLERLLERY